MTRLTKALALAALVALGVLVGFALRQTRSRLITYTRSGTGIMGTTWSITAVAPVSDRALADRATQAALAALGRVEAQMSCYLEQSELSQLNAAPAGQFVALTPETMDVLRLSRELAGRTDGAFDATCRPILQLWRQTSRAGHVPDARQIATAVDQSGWRHIDLGPDGATKRIDAACADLGGIAKGFGIDQAVEAMIAAGCKAGIVDVGGDVRCFGAKPDGGKWVVAVQSPFGEDEAIATLALQAGAVCTSGNYRRFSEIAGQRYSHIVDPRTGKPVDLAPSVTVVAPRAAHADAWATALSVLGPEGLALLAKQPDTEAMLFVGSPDNCTRQASEGFTELLLEVSPPSPENKD